MSNQDNIEAEVRDRMKDLRRKHWQTGEGVICNRRVPVNLK